MPGIDLRDATFLSHVEDQGDGTCCYAFTACGAVQYLYKSKKIRIFASLFKIYTRV
jgi:C1A family cysteine protease